MQMQSQGVYTYHDLKPVVDDMAGEVLRGMRQQPRHISPKYFYDAQGSALFEQITQLPEYYLTRTEMELFDAYLPDMAALLPERVCVVEYGSGSSLKIRKLLETLTPHAYVPVDISREHLQSNARRLHGDYPHINVHPICADITQPFSLPDEVTGLTRVAFFPGSSIGNFNPDEAVAFLRNVRDTVGRDGALLIGVDRKKSITMLERAYDDAAGVTAQFNLNVLVHLNDVLDSNFDPRGFEHVVRYNEGLGCIQMFLRSRRRQQVELAGDSFTIAEGEELHTENSFKYHPQEFLALAARSGFEPVHQWSDANEWFTLYLLRGV